MTRTRAALLLFTATSLGFNLDTEQLTAFRVDSAGFGDSVVQYANSWVVVGAPHERMAANQTGGLYQCSYSTGACQPISLQGESLAAQDPGPGSQAPLLRGPLLLCLEPSPSDLLPARCTPAALSRPDSPLRRRQTSWSPRWRWPLPSSSTALSVPLRVTMHVSVPTVPPEAVNMSLGLSLAATTSPSQLLVSGLGSQEAPAGGRGDPGPWGLGISCGVEVLECKGGREQGQPPSNPLCPQACGPTVHHACGRNMYLTGLCFLVAPAHLTQRLPVSMQECPRQEQDIVFLIDGSGSILHNNFATMKSFVRAVMSHFQRPSTQFSSKFRTHFTFKEFRDSSNPLSLLASVSQLGGYTHTATAIQKVVSELFLASNGARREATKILIVITDGKKEGDRLDYDDVIPMADKAGIIRYAIGVGSAFQNRNSWKELNDIASKPSQEHIFKVEDFDALKDIQNQLKEKIFAIEASPKAEVFFSNLAKPASLPGTQVSRLPLGTETTSSSSFELEMAQEGFSAVFAPDGPILGAVGSFSWSGGAFLYPPNMNPTFINMSQENVDMRDSYLGYSTQLALWRGAQSLVLGAPRYQHTGKAVIFTQVSRQWRMKAEVMGTQIGSYFGASLCSVDMDSDGSTDLILIGAPHYYEQTRGGQVSVCPLPRGWSRWWCNAVLRGEQGHPWGRFGAALTVLGDVNGDKLTDVAIGAPGEEEDRGAVYLFHGDLGPSISPSYSQRQNDNKKQKGNLGLGLEGLRITGSQFSPRLQYFGQALSGGQDLTQDGLVDLAVGARGQVLLLR
ncbi:hypothetical protein P7K49_023389 [Saguinus oedipus]|uniref:VWFA domain-containing protein n=1 Tax=Saguinus oedipus TaxID=9490 RepID=A0ABQ9ULI2_SAGOE|nr:hypothetical protein P7K49_023389 [Saguinus oedipus]